MAKKKDAALKARKKPVATTRRKRAAKAKSAEPVVSAALEAPRLDYPQEGERISSPVYTLRIDAPQEGMSIEVSIDRGPWTACRSSVGYWWFDWAGFGPGEHVVVTRVVTLDGQTSESPVRRCVVEL